MDWLRSGKKDKFDTPADDFKTLDQLFPETPGQKPEDRAKNLESALDWMRNNNVSPKEFTESPSKFDQLPSIPISRRTPEQSVDTIVEVLNLCPDTVKIRTEDKGDTLQHYYMREKNRRDVVQSLVRAWPEAVSEQNVDGKSLIFPRLINCCQKKSAKNHVHSQRTLKAYWIGCRLEARGHGRLSNRLGETLCW